MNKKIIRQLDNGLIIRHAGPEDTEALVKFNILIHSEDEWDEKGLADWTRDLISGESPIFDTDDFTIVEDPSTGEIVSSCCHISQLWSYEGIPFKVGRPELVGTSKEYRRQGLVRHQFEILHNWSKARGELVQAITGIPYYYRQFGYEMTLNLGGGRAGYEIHVPSLKEDEQETYTFRLAAEGDIPFLMATYKLGCQRNLVSAVWDEALWQYELTGKRPYNINRRVIYIVEKESGDPVGFIGIPPIKWGKNTALEIFELAPGHSWSDVTPAVIRFLWQTGARLAEEQNQPHKMFGFWLGEQHPAYQVAATKLPRVRDPYSYYIRVPDLPAFLQRITPVLQERLVGSAFANYSGALKLNFYTDGISLIFEKGRLEEIKSLSAEALDSCNANFPPLVFLHLVFGYRTMESLNHAFTDCSTKDDETRHLLNTLFPKKASNIWPIS